MASYVSNFPEHHIRYNKSALSRFLESCVDSSGKLCQDSAGKLRQDSAGKLRGLVWKTSWIRLENFVDSSGKLRQDSARLDVAVNGFWGGRSEGCFIDVRVFSPFAPSNSSSSLSSTFRKHEKIKHRAYGQHVREVERATFTPIVLAATGGLAHEATFFISDLLLFWPQSGEMIILWFLVGCVVA